MHGDDGHDLMRGGEGNDIMYGGEGNDRMSGNDGDDVMIAHDGTNRMIAGDGDDILIGGAGVDQASGGEGADIFVADQTSGNQGHMMIRDFNATEDSLYLQTGDVLTAQEMFDIFSLGATQDGRDVVFDNGSGELMTLLHTDLGDITVDSFYEADTSGDEEDFLLGFL